MLHTDVRLLARDASTNYIEAVTEIGLSLSLYIPMDGELMEFETRKSCLRAIQFIEA